ncbi:MAG: peptide chain release factor N(5)-glutamine methyltransferase [Gemmatimonadetes bacterium]|nr:peptide chain release factor N(5)-glutamine methyltransferase [Gemmatimonadota bacterium]MYG15816.1 peptide chain release factor N(5)-glutamine methyltransferase [Gemmatimonadota bacterium]
MNEFECPAASTVLQAVDWAARKLDGRPDHVSPAEHVNRVESELLLGEVCASSRLELYLDHDRRLEPQESSRFTALVDRRMRGEPVQYLTGRTEFYGRGFEVSPAVLIPRPETERLVDHVRPCLDGMRRERAGKPAVRFADIGTGSGVLAVTLALECPFAQGCATDISPEALEVARRNADRLLGDRHDRITFMQGSLLTPFDARGQHALDLIVANPPYVASREMDGLPAEVRGYEPRLALHGGKDGLEYHRALIEQAPGYLNAGGMIALEIGAGQSAAVARLMMERRAYGNVEIVKDYNGLDRIVSAKYVG